MELASLIRRGRDLDLQQKEIAEELKKIKATLIDQGAGEYDGTGGAKALVIFPSPSIKPDEAAMKVVKRLVAPKIYGKLFVETVVVAPVKEFRAFVSALIDDEGKRQEILTACEKEGSPQVRFS